MYQEKKLRVMESLHNRNIFSYNYFDKWLLEYFSPRICLCCRKRAKRKDWLWREAQKNYNKETDILEIVKNIRILQFLTHNKLKDYQRDLVSFFDDFTIKGLDPDLANFEQNAS